MIPIILIDILFIENFVSKSILHTSRGHYLTLLHGAICFIEKNLQAFYDNKADKNPLKLNQTPKFDPILSPKSSHSLGYSKS